MKMKKRKCIVCNCNNLKSLMVLNNMPSLAQNMPSYEELSEDKPLDLELCQCEKCGLVQFNIEPVFYYKDVIRAGGGTSTMKKLRLEEYSRLIEWMNKKNINGRRIVEIGCGKGEFLQIWNELDLRDEQSVSVSGIEHDEELCEIGRRIGLEIINTFAEGNNKYSNEKYDAFVQFNFLEHQPNPREMLRNIWNNLNKGAIGLVTVPSFEYILENDGYYELMRDHLAYYTLQSLKYLFENNGFKLLENRIVNRDTIEVIVERLDLISEAETPEIEIVNVDNLSENYKEISFTIQQHISQLVSKSKKLALWGASHQAFTLAATTELNGKVEYIIDSATFKHFKYSPVSHLLIVPPDYFFENPVDEILIVAPGYTEEIAQIIKNTFGKDVTILILKDKSIRKYENNQEI